MKKLAKLLLVGLLALTCLLGLCACGESQSGTAEYKVTVVDGVGAPYTSGVIVRFLQNGEQAAMVVVDENGVASKELPRGDYTVELMFTDENAAYYYEEEGLTLTADQTQLEILLLRSVTGEAQTIYAYSEKEESSVPYDAYHVGVGSSFVKLNAGDRTYFLFAPTEKGTYRFSVTGAECELGYYGSPYFVQTNNVGTVLEDGSFTVSISAGMIGAGDTGTTILVIGVDALDGAESCTLNVERIGDPEYSISDEPWLIYGTTAELKPYTLPAGTTLINFEFGGAVDPYELVFNEADSSYHLNSADGPQVLVWLGEDTQYIACFKTILDSTGVVKYFYDADGAFVKRENYNECLLEYIACMDEEAGVYPLTKDLLYIIQSAGEQFGWWDEDSSTYIFKDANGTVIPGVNPDQAWLVMCCYAG